MGVVEWWHVMNYLATSSFFCGGGVLELSAIGGLHFDALRHEVQASKQGVEGFLGEMKRARFVPWSAWGALFLFERRT